MRLPGLRGTRPGRVATSPRPAALLASSPIFAALSSKAFMESHSDIRPAGRSVFQCPGRARGAARNRIEAGVKYVLYKEVK